ncbi:MAG: hypothetical protein IT376_00945 [Polyangiaceae bacterium]|nr:hypothetical protein [Polyangiaceae bacterium]
MAKAGRLTGWLGLALAFGCSGTSDGGDSKGGFGGTAAGSATGGAGGGGNAANAGGTSGFGSTGSGGGGGVINVGGTSGGGAVAGGGGAAGECAGVEQTANSVYAPVDIIWAIDTSGSMTEETAAVQQNMNNFSWIIENAGIDFRIVMLAQKYTPPIFIIPAEGICIAAPLGSGQCPADSKPPRYNHLFETIGSTDALQKFISTYPTYQSVLRPNSVKIFTIVTDDDSAMSAAEFTNAINALDPAYFKPGQWKVYSVHCFTECEPWVARVGSVYTELVTQTGGYAGDLCLQSFNPVFQALAQGAVSASKLDCAWTIPPPPAGETFDKTKVNLEFTPEGGQKSTIGKVPSSADCGASGGWYYDNEASPTQVLVCPSTCGVLQTGGNNKVNLTFGCETEIIVPE